MKTIITLFLLPIAYLACFSQSDTQQSTNSYAFSFAGVDVIFPSTVRQAVESQRLDYKPPGYYYKGQKDGAIVILDYHHKPGDFHDEYQPISTLFERDIHSYIFQFPDTGETYDSLKASIEEKFSKQFVLTKGIKDSEYARIKEFEFNFLTVDSLVTVGIKKSKPESRNKLVTVRFMYNLPLGKMGIVMGSY